MFKNNMYTKYKKAYKVWTYIFQVNKLYSQYSFKKMNYLKSNQVQWTSNPFWVFPSNLIIDLDDMFPSA